MADVFTKTKRSEVMSRIHGRGNKDTEIALMKLLRRHHIAGWRRNQTVFGKPDFVFPKARLALFVDGCFWHGCPKHCNTPASNRAFWTKKLAANKARDRRVNQTLRKSGWRVVRLWEHDLAKRGAVCICRIQAALVVRTPRRSPSPPRSRACRLGIPPSQDGNGLSQASRRAVIGIRWLI